MRLRCGKDIIIVNGGREHKIFGDQGPDEITLTSYLNEWENESYYYLCPMFKTGKRSSIIASSGNSLEKVLDVELPSKENKDYWILRGAALLMQLDD